MSGVGYGTRASGWCRSQSMPNANAYAERFVRSIREECSNRIIPIGARHFRQAIAEVVKHYHRERNIRVLTID